MQRTNPEGPKCSMDGPPGFLFRNPAQETERKLGIKLPADYEEFLSIMNGFEQSRGGIVLDSPLHPVSNIRWLEDNEDYLSISNSSF
ncbi:hypothetical protein I7I50_00961 [Histoplasma capsulatum G186AR]|uniref:Knr4/Smi1-like domain-containing protein n=1 Tax=Ajellomyces capsulatus TaxID=5037 RepID=A0A8H7YKA8_AJECA|nr:hypothetical protein I7I52_08227 [Histoplasma capsulatum]QSS72956.1 hypothetical protein I7I50_00961 [Histoplasma capsulatum G186AR]